MDSDSNPKPEIEDYPYVVIGLGVDWLTVTGKTEDSWTRVWNGLAPFCSSLVEDGERAIRTSRNGYSLSTVRGISYGRGPQGWMVVLSGQDARRLYRAVGALSANCSRIDLQVTVRYMSGAEWAIVQLYNKCDQTWGDQGTKGKTLYLSGERGNTLYVGSRTSAQMGRIYDKGKQSRGNPEFDNCIRFEVEYKKPLSKQVLDWLLHDDPPNERIVDKVLSWFQKRYIVPPPVFTYVDNAIQFPTKANGLERRLDWLRRQVRPAYQQLRLLGFQSEADEAIGVADEAETASKGGAK